uniref:C-type lectin domain-containing protein n=1 Tax=Caenorhabditis japonica TaxID=281687 RepID=A0A8R1HNG9_CAEJA
MTTTLSTTIDTSASESTFVPSSTIQPSNTAFSTTGSTVQATSTIAPTSTNTASTEFFGSGSTSRTVACVNGCEDGWFRTVRGGETLCMRLFFHNTSTYTDASNFCEVEKRGFLTGPDTNLEYDEIIRQAYNNSDVLDGMAPFNEGMIMIGAKRTLVFEWKNGIGAKSNTHFNDHMGTRDIECKTRICVGILVYTNSSKLSQDLVYSLSCEDGTTSTNIPTRMVVCGKGTCESSTSTTASSTTELRKLTSEQKVPTTETETTAVSSTSTIKSTTIDQLSTDIINTSNTVAITASEKTSTHKLATSWLSTIVSTTIQTQTTSSIDFEDTCSGDCEEGWFKTVRGGQIFCIHLFYHDSKNYTAASDYCETQFNAVLTGPNTNDEYNYIIGQVYTQTDVLNGMNSEPYEKAMMIIGAQKQPGCTTDDGSIDSSCKLPQGFVWMDGLGETSNTLFNQHFNPQGVETSMTNVRACAGILVYRNSSWMSQDLVYSMDCTDATSSDGTPSRMLVCGKRQCSSSSTTASTLAVRSRLTPPTSAVANKVSSSTPTFLISTLLSTLTPSSNSEDPETEISSKSTAKPISTVITTDTLSPETMPPFTITIINSTQGDATSPTSTTTLPPSTTFSSTKTEPQTSTSTKLVPSSTLNTTVALITLTTLLSTKSKTCTDSSLICAESWTFVQRTNNRHVCLKVLNGYNMTYDESDNLCKSQNSNSYLSGIETVDEYETVVGLAQKTVNYTTSWNEQILVTIAMKRRVLCYAKLDDEDCSMLKANTWQDHSVQYQNILEADSSLWAEGQPAINSTVPLGCVGIQITLSGSSESDNGKMYSTSCETGQQITGTSNSALCARPPDVCS